MGKELIITLALQHQLAESVQVIVNMPMVEDFGEKGNPKKRPSKSCNDLKLILILKGNILSALSIVS